MGKGGRVWTQKIKEDSIGKKKSLVKCPHISGWQYGLLPAFNTTVDIATQIRKADADNTHTHTDAERFISNLDNHRLENWRHEIIHLSIRQCDGTSTAISRPALQVATRDEYSRLIMWRIYLPSTSRRLRASYSDGRGICI